MARHCSAASESGPLGPATDDLPSSLASQISHLPGLYLPYTLAGSAQPIGVTFSDANEVEEIRPELQLLMKLPAPSDTARR